MTSAVPSQWSRWSAIGELSRRKGRKFWIFTSIAAFSFLFFLWFVPWIPMLYLGQIEVMRLDAKGKPISSYVGPATKQWASIDRVSKHLIHAIVVAEDGKFYSHFGFDFEALRKAYALNKKSGRFVRGGSTISQQVVKMAFLTREKTYTRKMREALGTILLEMLFSKDRILEWYINLTEFGGGIYGVKQAGQYYFQTRPDLLTTEQAIHLALVVPSPNKWSKGLRAKSLTPFGHRRFARIANNLSKAGFLSAAERDAVLLKGNFGLPIAGYQTVPAHNATDDDDCAGDQDCKDDGPSSSGEKSETDAAKKAN
jgi:monofunctional glycosyltransferase